MEASPVTFALIFSAGFISMSAFRRPELLEKLLFWPYVMQQDKSWYRFISSGFVHGSWSHLLVNLWVLWVFGTYVEQAFNFYFGTAGSILYAFMYLSAIPISEIYSYKKNLENPKYRSLGASGAIAAVLFSFIIIEPLQGIGIIFIPIYIPAFLFGILYLLYSYVMAKKNIDNVGHDVHFFGALYGVIFTILARPAFIGEFIDKLTGYIG